MVTGVTIEARQRKDATPWSADLEQVVLRGGHCAVQEVDDTVTRQGLAARVGEPVGARHGSRLVAASRPTVSSGWRLANVERGARASKPAT
jgi:hypothetical protein